MIIESTQISLRSGTKSLGFCWGLLFADGVFEPPDDACAADDDTWSLLLLFDDFSEEEIALVSVAGTREFGIEEE